MAGYSARFDSYFSAQVVYRKIREVETFAQKTGYYFRRAQRVVSVAAAAQVF